MAQLNSIVTYLDSLLKPSDYEDYGFNGLQLESPRSDIRKVAFAVDAGLSVIEEAVAQDAHLLIVHHGMMWGKPEPITGAYGRKVELLLRSRCSLYASHLPLDAHSEVGNAFELARFFEIQNLEPFFEHHGRTIGARGKFSKGREFAELIERSKAMVGSALPLALPCGKNFIESVGIVTGSGSLALEECARAGLDLLISGEPKHEVFHRAKELSMNALFTGHYASETFGVSALSKRIKRDFDVETLFIDEPSGI